MCHPCVCGNVFDFEGFKREAEEYICSYTNFLNTVGSFMRNVNLAAPKKEDVHEEVR